MFHPVNVPSLSSDVLVLESCPCDDGKQDSESSAILPAMASQVEEELPEFLELAEAVDDTLIEWHIDSMTSTTPTGCCGGYTN